MRFRIPRPTYIFTTFALTISMFAATPAGALVSDDFHAMMLDTGLWEFVNPAGDASYTMTGTNLVFRVPGRASHAMWPPCNCAPQFLQSTANTNFEIEAKFDSKPSVRYEIQGIVVVEDADTYLRFDVYHDGTNVNIFAAYVNGVNPPQTKISQTLPGVPSHLRVGRVGNTWTLSYSDDGSGWTSVGSFARSIAVAKSGVFAANQGSPADYDTPEFVCSVDYFFNTAAVVSPEDDGEAPAASHPSIEAWYGSAQDFGALGKPQQQLNILGNVWDVEPVSSLSYSVNGGPTQGLPIGPDGGRLVGYGDYNIEIDPADLIAGANHVLITAIDTLGERRDTTLTLNYIDSVMWALPDTVDWQAATVINDVANVVDGRWHLTSDGTRTDTLTAGFERLLALGDVRWPTDYEVTLPFTVHELNIGGTSQVGIFLGWQGHDGAGQPSPNRSYQAGVRFDYSATNPRLRLLSDGDVIEKHVPATVVVGSRYLLKVRSQTLGSGQAQVRAKIWEDGQPEPGAWSLSDVFTERDGSVLLMAHHTDLTFGNVTIEPLPTLGTTLTTPVTGGGSVVRSPDFELYQLGTSVQLTAEPDSGWLFLQWTDGASGETNPLTVIVGGDTTIGAEFVRAIQSDDFNSTEIDTTLWRLFDPVGDVTVVATGTNILMHLPGGVEHNLWNTHNTAPRLLQATPNTDFDVQVGFNSKGSRRFEGQGIIIQEDDDTYLRCDTYHDGSVPHIFAAFLDGASTPFTHINLTVADTPLHLRVTRTGDSWELLYSDDGISWISAGTFTRSMAVSEVGVSVVNGANLGAYWETPASTGNIDYFFNTIAPIVPEDGGNPDAPTPPVVEVWYGDSQDAGQLGIPQRWLNIPGNVWDSDELASLSYTLNGGAPSALTIGPDNDRLVHVGDYNIEINYDDLFPGANEVVITALDTLGEQTNKTVTINYTDGVVWPMPTTAAFETASSIQDEAVVVDGLWRLEAGGVRTHPANTGYDRLLAFGNQTWSTDYEVAIPITVHASELGGLGGIGVAIGWQGHEGGGQPRLTPPYQTLAFIRQVTTNPVLQLMRDGNFVEAETPVAVQLGVTYTMKLRSQALGGGVERVSVKLWEEGTAEPTNWDLTDDFVARDGSVLLVAHLSDVTFGDGAVSPTSALGHVLNTNSIGAGTVEASPEFELYQTGTNVELTAVPDSGWVFTGWSDSLSGNPTSLTIMSDTTVTATFVPDIQSDDFYAGALNTDLWRVVDPRGDATFVMSGTNLIVDVAGGVSHDLSGDCNCAPRILQSAPDIDFDIQAKFDSRGARTYQAQGIVVQADDDTYLRFDIVYRSNGRSLYAAYVDGGTTTTLVNKAITIDPRYLRVIREGDTWKIRYSEDGSNWMLNFPIVRPLSVTEVGVSFMNHDDNVYSTPGYTGNLDYFMNARLPIVLEDNGLGSAPTPPVVEVWDGTTKTFGTPGIPQRWANVVGRVWDPDAIAALSYRLNGGPSTPLILGPDGLRLIGIQDFNVEVDYADLEPGANTVVITATDTLGEYTDQEVTIDYIDTGVTPIPHQCDWQGVVYVSGTAHIIDGRWDIVADGIRTNDHSIGYDRLIGIGDMRWTGDYEVLLPVTIHDTNPGGTPGIGIITGWQGHAGSQQPHTDWPLEAIGWVRGVGGSPYLELRDEASVHAQTGVPIALDTRYYLKLRTETVAEGQRHVSVKFWQDGDTEPDWQLDDDFTSRDGAVALVAHYAVVTFGDVAVTPLGGASQTYTITTQAVGGGSISRDPNQPTYLAGDTVLVSAEPDSGWSFSGWSGGLTGSQNPDTIVVASDTTLVATFEPTGVVLSVTVNGGGRVVKSPNLASYAPGTQVVLTAQPSENWLFASWSDGLVGSQNPDTIVVVSDTSVTANFIREPRIFTMRVSGNGVIITDPPGPAYGHGDTIIVTAQPDSGNTFYGWSDDLSGNQNPDTVVVTGDMLITATFFGIVTGIGDTPSITALTVLQNAPNPFVAETYFEYGLPEASDVRIEVFDVAGRRVLARTISQAEGGWHRFTLSGTDAMGRPLPSGVYFYRVSTPEKALTRKMVIVR